MINLNIIAQFDYNDKTYVYYIDNNKLNFGYKDIDIINNNLNEKEFQLMKEILPKITVSSDEKNHLTLGITFYNNKKFQIMLDKKSGLKFFYEIKIDGLTLPNISDASVLFFKFNNSEIYDIGLYSSKENIEKNLKKYVLLTSSLSTIAITIFFPIAKMQIDKLENHGYSAPNYVSIENYSYNKISKLIVGNPNLSIDEKKFFLSNSDIFEENKDYIDMNYLEKILPKLTVIYAGDDRKTYQAEKYILGKFHPDSDSIIIFDSTNFKNCNKDILAHEFCHVLTPQFLSLGAGLIEAVNETIQNEYYDKIAENSQGYYLPCIALKMLCEIIGPEVFREFHFTGNINVVIDEIKNVIGNEREAIELVSSIDNIVIYNCEQLDLTINKKNEKDYDEKIKENKRNIANNDHTFYKLIKKCFEEKYEYKMEDDQTMMLYTNQMGFIDKSEKIFEKGIVSVYNKGYFSHNYINKNPKISYTYWDEIKSKNINVSIEKALKMGLASVSYVDEKPIYTCEVGLSLDNQRVHGVLTTYESDECVIEKDSRRNKISRNR